MFYFYDKLDDFSSGMLEVFSSSLRDLVGDLERDLDWRDFVERERDPERERDFERDVFLSRLLLRL